MQAFIGGGFILAAPTATQNCLPPFGGPVSFRFPLQDGVIFHPSVPGEAGFEGEISILNEMRLVLVGNLFPVRRRPKVWFPRFAGPARAAWIRGKFTC